MGWDDRVCRGLADTTGLPAPGGIEAFRGGYGMRLSAAVVGELSHGLLFLPVDLVIDRDHPPAQMTSEVR